MILPFVEEQALYDEFGDFPSGTPGSLPESVLGQPGGDDLLLDVAVIIESGLLALAQLGVPGGVVGPHTPDLRSMLRHTIAETKVRFGTPPAPP